MKMKMLPMISYTPNESDTMIIEELFYSWLQRRSAQRYKSRNQESRIYSINKLISLRDAQTPSYRYRWELISLGMLYANELLRSFSFSFPCLAFRTIARKVFHRRETEKSEKLSFCLMSAGKTFPSISTFFYLAILEIFFKLILLSSAFPLLQLFHERGGGKFDCIRCVYFKTWKNSHKLVGKLLLESDVLGGIWARFGYNFSIWKMLIFNFAALWTFGSFA